MAGFGILMIVLGVLMILIGLHIYTGHDFFLARGYYKRASDEYLRFVGIVMFSISVAPIISGIVAFFTENVFLPFIILIIGIVLGFYIPIKIRDKKNAK